MFLWIWGDFLQSFRNPITPQNCSILATLSLGSTRYSCCSWYMPGGKSEVPVLNLSLDMVSVRDLTRAN